jgi:hypothetical protein
MSFNVYKITFLFCAGLILNSCSVLEPSPPAAAFIHIDSIPVSTVYATQGSNAHRITDVWVIFDDKFLGTFPLPADFPVLGTGNQQIQVRAGVIENGVASTRSAYPKYSLFDTTLNLTANEKTIITPHVTYAPGAQFPQIEDFDDASLSLSSVNVNYANLSITQTNDTNAFESNSGVVTLDDNHTIFESASSSPFTLPLNVPSYLELNYKGECEFQIGTYINTSAGVVRTSLLTLKESAQWKKVYVSLSDLGGVQQSGIGYKVYLHALKPGNVSTAKLYFDNLKVVY